MSITSRIRYDGSLRTTAIHLPSNNQISTDAPKDNHGNGALFSPTDFAATSLGSCMLTVMGIAARDRDIPFEHIECSITKIMASGPRRISEIHVRMEVDQQWTTDQKEIMERVAVTCPVANSLNPSIKQNVTFNYSE